jgi:hypothetical protein
MKYTRVNQSTPQSMRLQSVGWVQGQPAANIKKGDFLMWNFGCKTEIKAVRDVSAKSIEVDEMDGGKIYTRRFLKTRLVCILEK